METVPNQKVININFTDLTGISDNTITYNWEDGGFFDHGCRKVHGSRYSLITETQACLGIFAAKT
jgi:hypothetical protein